jgi:hypothetical protein
VGTLIYPDPKIWNKIKIVKIENMPDWREKGLGPKIPLESNLGSVKNVI